MRNLTGEEIGEALRPIASLIGKSEKAQRKLASGTWQYAMLCDNLKALHIASALMNNDVADFARGDLQKALRALDSMISRSEKAQSKFSPETSQHTLLENRIRALRMAAELIGNALEAQGGEPSPAAR